MKTSRDDLASSTDEETDHRQPYLHDLVCTVKAPFVVLSGTDGQIRSVGVQGSYLADRRVLSRFVVSVDEDEPTSIGSHIDGGASAHFTSVLRRLGDRGADPTVILHRTRELRPGAWAETIMLTSYARATVSAIVRVHLASDFSDIMSVKAGRTSDEEVTPSVIAAGLRWHAPGSAAITVTTTPPPAAIEPRSGSLAWAITLPPGGRASITLDIVSELSTVPAVLPGPAEPVFARPVVHAPDPRLATFVEQSLADLTSLQLADPQEPADVFLGAGAPWFLTLFGRDSLWAARMMLPLGTELAAGTLRALARRQGQRTDPETAEEPGKILHELRSPGLLHDEPGTATTRPRVVGLPPLFYGTVDATPLWISLLHDAWRWGMPESDVRDLLDHLERALAWMRDSGMGPHGFLQYQDKTGRGLSNQGWKDSEDSIQFGDGRLAQAPIALCEVQAYAHAAARHGADLLDAFGRPGSAEWRRWADDLRRRFRAEFWIPDPDGAYPAVAIDGAGRRVDTVTSNLGHLLGTGLLNDDETALVVAQLANPQMSSGYGLRTLSMNASGYNPLAYHGGSIWTHDTAIAVLGLRTVATPAADDAARTLIAGIVEVAAAFANRMPELYGGWSRSESPTAIPYPAACRPQAWSAASAVAILAALLGLRVDVPGNSVEASPLSPSPVGNLTVSGLRIGGRHTTVRVDDTARATIEHVP